ncbi:hypothetical protein SEUCBS140593_000535 [Sporothrix eucalyptigena]|uniref:Uncharacterized protein n=1 Tax=Sporothrix eucalyptigena TaxID=1812306 RepID=A0ABP0AQM5_9PEZI
MTPVAGPIYRHGNSDILLAWSQREAAAAEQPWTATRCHRQLRPLLTHLMALRREKARAALKKRNESLRQPLSPNKRLTADDDLASRKRVRYTYSLKGRRRQGRPSATSKSIISQTEEEPAQRIKVAPLMQQARRSFCPGEVVLATPVLSRARKHRQAWSLPSSPLTHRKPDASVDSSLLRKEQVAPKPKAKNTSFKYRGYYQDSIRINTNNNAKPSNNPSMDADWAALFSAISPESRQMYEAIFRAVEALLRSTTNNLEPARTPNSLLAMCLRKVPQYIAVCEEAEREEAEKEGVAKLPSSSVSLEIYSDLESLGGGDRGGWKHLRTVVQQHGIDILKAACAEGLLHETFIRLLVRLCTHMKAYDEAEGLMTALFDSHISSLCKGQHLYEKPEGGSDPVESTGPTASLNMLLQYAEETGRTSSSLQKITELLSHGHLPSAWLICAVGILQKEAVIESSDNHSSHEPAVLKRLSVIIQRSLSEVSQKIKRRKGQHKAEAAAHCFPRQHLLILAACLVRPGSEVDNGGHPSDMLKQLVEEATPFQKGQVYNATVVLVTSVAENCGRASESAVSGVPASRSYLLELCSQAANHIHSTLDYGSESSLTTRLQADAAFLLASRSNDLRDLAFAESLGKSSVQTNDQRPASSGPRTGHPLTSTTDGACLSPPSRMLGAPVTALFEGYRWEEGISEWVISTPRPTSRPRPIWSPEPRRNSELVVVLDDFFHEKPVKQDKARPFQRPTQSHGRLSLPASLPPSSPTTGDDSDMDDYPSPDKNSNTTTPMLPRTPTSKSSSQARNVRHLRLIPRMRATRSLLTLVSDNEVGEEDDSDEYEIEGGPHDEQKTTRTPLFDLGNAKNIKRTITSGNTQQKKGVAACDSDDYADATISDDELGL